MTGKGILTGPTLGKRSLDLWGGNGELDVAGGGRRAAAVAAAAAVEYAVL